MAKRKYDKYFIEYDPKQWTPLPQIQEPSPMRIISRIDDHIIKGSFYYLVHWLLPGIPIPGLGHPPHIHKDAELLFHIGANPDDPMDLGAEVEFYVGPELERHIITRSTVVYIPPNFIHCPWKPLRSERPWLFIQVNQGPVHTEKGFHQLLPKEQREKYAEELALFKDEGY